MTLQADMINVLNTLKVSRFSRFSEMLSLSHEKKNRLPEMLNISFPLSLHVIQRGQSDNSGS